MASGAPDLQPSVLVELLGFAGCPNVAPALAMIDRVAGELDVAVAVEWIEIADAEGAAGARFLGSPSIRVNGRDIEPGADQRTEFSYSCRTYPTPRGRAGVPAEAWVRAALRRAS